MNKITAITTLLLLFICSMASVAQVTWDKAPMSEYWYPTASQLRSDVEYLSSDSTKGRGRGSAGHKAASDFICERFANAGLLSLGSGYEHFFGFNDGWEHGHNIAGLFPGMDNYPCYKYIVVGAHYDHLGTIKGITYPGADSNASGVAALMELADWFRGQRKGNIFYGTSIIFVAFDAYMDGRIGSEAFIKALKAGEFKDPVSKRTIRPSDIVMMVDLDQIGSSMAPPDKVHRDYIIALGEDSLLPVHRGILDRCNEFYGTNLRINRDYYGSPKFTKAFYNLGDRGNFIRNNIPTIYFTSGITDFTNKAEDTASTLDYDIFRRRTILIARFIEKAL